MQLNCVRLSPSHVDVCSDIQMVTSWKLFSWGLLCQGTLCPARGNIFDLDWEPTFSPPVHKVSSRKVGLGVQRSVPVVVFSKSEILWQMAEKKPGEKDWC